MAPNKLWINEVGTSGVGSASYLLSNLSAGTCSLPVFVVANIWQLVFAEVVNRVVQGPNLFVDLLPVVLWQIRMGSLPLPLLGTSIAEALSFGVGRFLPRLLVVRHRKQQRSLRVVGAVDQGRLNGWGCTRWETG